MGRSITYDSEKVSFNLARLKKGGETFEVAIDPDLAVKFKKKEDVDLSEVLKSEKIFADVKKGQLASIEKQEELFATSEVMKVARIILEEGEIQFTQEYRDKLMEEKRNKIINLIHKKGIDPRSGLPHPISRIENAFEEGKIRVDYFKRSEDQIEEIVKKLRPILPIRFEMKRIEVKVDSNYSSKVYSSFQSMGKIINQEWRADGGLNLTIEIPAGLQEEFYNKLNSITHGQNQTRIIE